MKKIGLIFLLSFFLLIPFISADAEAVVFLLIGLSIFFFIKIAIIVIFIEALLFWILSKKILKKEIKFGKALAVSAIANVITTFIGLISILARGNINLLFLFLILVAISIVIEFGIFLLFFRKTKIKKSNLFLMSLILNLISSLILYFFFLR